MPAGIVTQSSEAWNVFSDFKQSDWLSSFLFFPLSSRVNRDVLRSDAVAVCKYLCPGTSGRYESQQRESRKDGHCLQSHPLCVRDR